MEYRRLGRSGLEVSAVGLGTNNFGTRADVFDSVRVVERALDLGVNMIDTSNSYGQGLSEEYLGRALKGQRHLAVIATKVSSRVEEGPNRAGNSRQHILSEVENSLRRLGTDYIDLYQIHWIDPSTPIEETLRTLDDLIHQGKVRYAGCSNFMAWQVCEAVWTSRSLGIDTFASVLPRYNLVQREIEAELLPFCEEYGLGVLPYYPLASGFLTGKYRRDTPPAAGTRLAAGDRGLLTADNFDVLEKVQAFAAERGRTVLDLAFAWLLSRPIVSSVISGAMKPEQLESNVKAGEWRLSSDDAADLNGLLSE